MLMFVILFVIFLGLKVFDYIDWSWFWVASPLLIGGVLVLVVYLTAVLGFFWVKKKVDDD